MAGEFPKLKTGAVMQYPARRDLEYATQVYRFVDGTEQRYRERGSPARRWVVHLERLDEGELQELQEFFSTAGGRAGSFTFMDPWDEVTYEDCSLESDVLEVEVSGEMRGKTTLVIRENRS